MKRVQMYISAFSLKVLEKFEIHFFKWEKIFRCDQRENTIRDSLQKFITLHKARLVGGWRLVQNACRNWAIAPGVTQRGPKYAQEP